MIDQTQRMISTRRSIFDKELSIETLVKKFQPVALGNAFRQNKNNITFWPFQQTKILMLQKGKDFHPNNLQIGSYQLTP